MSLGERLTALRFKKKLTQEQVSERLGIKRARYSSWENNNSEPDLEMINKLAQLHDISTDYILGINRPSNDTKQIEDKRTWSVVARANELPEERREEVLAALEAIIKHHEEMNKKKE